MNYSTCLFVLLSLLWSNNLFAYDIAVENVDGVTIYYTNEAIEDGKVLGGFYVDSDLMRNYNIGRNQKEEG